MIQQIDFESIFFIFQDDQCDGLIETTKLLAPLLSGRAINDYFSQNNLKKF